jgi:hypothetical protein
MHRDTHAMGLDSLEGMEWLWWSSQWVMLVVSPHIWLTSTARYVYVVNVLEWADGESRFFGQDGRMQSQLGVLE